MKIKKKMKKFENFINILNENFNNLKKDDNVKIHSNNIFIGVFKIINVYKNKNNINCITVQNYNDDLTLNDTIFNISNLDLDYKIEKMNISYSAGILFIYNNKILLVHNIKNCDNYSYPKGNNEPNETFKDTAIRETLEEIGINIPKHLLLDDQMYKFGYIKPQYLKYQIYYVLKLTDEQFKHYFNTMIISKENFNDEIDWAGFINLEKAKDILKPQFLIILKHLI
jgi:ADP-ribose pyrophosphatase YjhB (NUDIX family)